MSPWQPALTEEGPRRKPPVQPKPQCLSPCKPTPSLLELTETGGSIVAPAPSSQLTPLNSTPQVTGRSTTTSDLDLISQTTDQCLDETLEIHYPRGKPNILLIRSPHHQRVFSHTGSLPDFFSPCMDEDDYTIPTLPPPHIAPLPLPSHLHIKLRPQPYLKPLPIYSYAYTHMPVGQLPIAHGGQAVGKPPL